VKLDLQLADIEAHFFGQVVVGRMLASGLLSKPSEMVQFSLFVFCEIAFVAAPTIPRHPVFPVLLLSQEHP
jgi:hypothetical protein